MGCGIDTLYLFLALVLLLRIHFSTGYGRKDVVEFLLTSGASIHARDDGGLHPLHNACSFGHADVVRLLLEADANPNTRDNWNFTPLHEAAAKGKIDVCIGKCPTSVLRIWKKICKYI